MVWQLYTHSFFLGSRNSDFVLGENVLTFKWWISLSQSWKSWFAISQCRLPWKGGVTHSPSQRDWSEFCLCCCPVSLPFCTLSMPMNKPPKIWEVGESLKTSLPWHQQGVRFCSSCLESHQMLWCSAGVPCSSCSFLVHQILVANLSTSGNVPWPWFL